MTPDDQMTPDDPTFGRAGKREPVLNAPAVIIVMIAAMAVVHAVRTHVLSPATDGLVIYFGSVIPLRFTLPALDPLWPALVSPISYSLLHGSWTHLIINSVWLLAFGAPLARRIGVGRFLLFWCLTSVAGAAAHVLAAPNSNIPMIGASGVVSGITAAAARFAFKTTGSDGQRGFASRALTLRETYARRDTVTFILVWFAINASLSLGWFDVGGDGSSIAWQAHIGGFVAGLFALPFFLHGTGPAKT